MCKVKTKYVQLYSVYCINTIVCQKFKIKTRFHIMARFYSYHTRVGMGKNDTRVQYFCPDLEILVLEFPEMGHFITKNVILLLKILSHNASVIFLYTDSLTHTYYKTT